jgi:hypothetical protein
MASTKGRSAALMLAVCFAGGIAAGHALARWTANRSATTGDASVAPGTNAVAALPERNGGSAAATAAASTVKAPPAPLPSRDLPIADYYDELAQRARDGDATAARRLADDLYSCATRDRQLDMAERLLQGADHGGRRRGPGAERGPGGGGPAGGGPGGAGRGPFLPLPGDGGGPGDENFAERRINAAERFVANAVATEKRCEGIAAEKVAESADWIRQAALAGDVEAKLCYAIAPNEWNRDVLSPQWVDWAERWNTESPAMVRQAFESGLPEAAAVLSNMYAAWQPREPRPWSGRLGDDPYWSYAYAVVAQQTLSSTHAARWAEIVRQRAAALNADQIARADAWAGDARSRIRFQPPATGPAPDNSLCGNIRRSGGF